MSAARIDNEGDGKLVSDLRMTSTAQVLRT